ncbi:HES1B factor, partial [Cepphus grylle]|nr:HES1B factor [Cepphus grylle]
MPADLMEKSSASPVAATPASVNATPDKPKTAAEHRKSSKPIMEKRRRARINESLGQLKTLILDALKKDVSGGEPGMGGGAARLPDRSEPRLSPQSSRHSKLEKADILEMTVKHLRSLQRAQMTAALSTDPTVLGKYRAGFSECMNEVTRFLSTCEGVNTEVRTRLLGHLASCMTQINAMNYPAPPPPPPLPPAAAFGPPLVPPGSGAGPLPGMPCKPGADAAKVYGGFQLLPASDGQFAFLIPSTAFAPGGAVLPLYGGPPTAATAASPPGPPPGTADSVWRPW